MSSSLLPLSPPRRDPRISARQSRIDTILVPLRGFIYTAAGFRCSSAGNCGRLDSLISGSPPIGSKIYADAYFRRLLFAGKRERGKEEREDTRLELECRAFRMYGIWSVIKIFCPCHSCSHLPPLALPLFVARVFAARIQRAYFRDAIFRTNVIKNATGRTISLAISFSRMISRFIFHRGGPRTLFRFISAPRVSFRRRSENRRKFPCPLCRIQ